MYGISDPLLALMFLGTLLLLAKFGEEIFERLKLVPYLAAIELYIEVLKEDNEPIPQDTGTEVKINA